MKKLLLSVGIFLTLSSVLFSQMPNPTIWTFSAEKQQEGIYELRLSVEIEGSWNIYSQYIEEGGPVPTSFEFTESAHYQLEGKCEELGKKKEGFDELFDMDVIKFANKVDFVQKVKVSDTEAPIVGQVEFMVCNDESCLPPKVVDFSISLPTQK